MTALTGWLFTMVVVFHQSSIPSEADLRALFSSSDDDDSSVAWPVSTDTTFAMPESHDMVSAAYAISAADLAAMQVTDSDVESVGSLHDLTVIPSQEDFQALFAGDSTSSTDEDCVVRKLQYHASGLSTCAESDILPCVLLPSSPDSTRSQSPANVSSPSCWSTSPSCPSSPINHFSSGSTTETNSPCSAPCSPGLLCSPRSPASSAEESIGDDLPEDLFALAKRHMCFDGKVAKSSTKRTRKYNRRSPSSESSIRINLDRPKSKKKVCDFLWCISIDGFWPWLTCVFLWLVILTFIISCVD